MSEAYLQLHALLWQLMRLLYTGGPTDEKNCA